MVTLSTKHREDVEEIFSRFVTPVLLAQVESVSLDGGALVFVLKDKREVRLIGLSIGAIGVR